MPLTNNPNEALVYNYLITTAGYNVAVACGIMANIYKESSFNTSAVGDGGTSIGLCQWHAGRATNLKNYCQQKGYDYLSVEGQMSFFLHEINSGSYNPTKNAFTGSSNDANGAYNVGYWMCKDFERSAGGETNYKSRGDFAKNTVYPMYKDSVSPVSGSDIVATAVSKLNSAYMSGGYGPDKFCSYGLVYYCYKKNGIDIPKSVKDQASMSGISNITSNFQAGDVLFFNGETRTSTDSIVYSAIATGVGNEFIGCMGYPPYMNVMRISLEDDPWKDKFIGAVRILNNGTGSNYNNYNGYVSNNGTYNNIGLAGTSIPISSTDSYESNLESALSVLAENGEIYSSIINLRDGTEFKFYTNVSVSENLPVSYSSPGNVLGRSVPVLGYDSTGARTVAVTLDLFAGENYRPDLDPNDNDLVGILHKDLDLLKSFEYPDYTTAIVIPPPVVLLSIGATLKIRGVLQGLTIEYLRPFDSKNRAMYAKVSFTVTQVSENPPDYTDIRNRTSRSY